MSSTFGVRFIFNMIIHSIPATLSITANAYAGKAGRRRRDKKDLSEKYKSIRKNFIRKEFKKARLNANVQEKNITFPVDWELTKKVLKHCKRIAKKECIKMDSTFGQEIKEMKYQLQFVPKAENVSKMRKSQKRLHKITFKIS